MAQDTTPAIEVYQGDGSNNTFSVHFDKGYYGEIKVAFVKRGLTDYEYDPDTYEVSGRLYAWSAGNTTYYTHTPNPTIGASVYDEQDVDTGLSITEVSGITITVNNRAYARAQQHDIANNLLLTWTGDTLNVGDYICIVRETERGQPYELPINQKQIEGALDNIERQVQELKAKTDNALLVDPTRIADASLMGPVQWMETILRSIDLSVRELRYYDGWLQYSLDDPKSASEDKTWHSLLNTTNIKSIYYKYTEDEQGRPLYNVYYVDNTDTERLLTYDAQAQRDDIDKLKQDVETNRQSIEAEKQVRREADENLRRYIDEKALQVDQFDGRITQNEEDIADIQSKIDPTASATDPLVPKSYVDNQLAGIYHIKGVVDTVNDLPTTGNTPGDCYNVLEDRQTYIWTEAGEWVATGEVADLTPYRTADDQDVIDATKQDVLSGSTYIDITENVVTMTGKFGSSFDMNGKNLILKDQDGNTLDETLIGIGVDAEYTPAEEDIEFNESEGGDISFITERLNAIEEKIPDDASSSNKFATADDIGDATLTIQRNNTTVDTFSANATENKTINIAVPTTAADVDALPDTTKYAANMSLSINSSTYVVTAQLKDQDGNNIGSAQTIDLPLESVVVSGSYDSTSKKIVLTLKDGSTIDIPVGDLISGLQSEITDSNKLSADLVDDTTTTHKFVTATDKTTWSGKQDKLTEGENISIDATNTISSKNPFRGEYDAEKTYNVGDYVWWTTKNNMYVCILDNTTNVLPSNTLNWRMLNDRETVKFNEVSSGNGYQLGLVPGYASGSHYSGVMNFTKKAPTVNAGTGSIAGYIHSVETMPTASADYLDEIVMFQGTTTSTYTNGYIYKCVTTGTVTPSSATASQTSGSSLSDVTVDVATFESQLDTTGSYVFTFDGSNWKRGSTTVSLPEYGITYVGTPVADDAITAAYTEPVYSYAWNQVTVQPQGDPLPSQAGNNGKYLRTNGETASWETIPEAETYIAGDNITIAGVLPDGYTLVEYIESDGTDYIDTGKKWDSNSVIVVKAKGINTTSGSTTIAGAVADGTGFQIITEQNRIGWQIGGAGYTHTSTNVADEVKVDVPNTSAYFNGTLISDSYEPTTANINVYLFANNNAGTAARKSHVRIFRYTCYSRYNLPVIDLVPCKNSNNVYGFYDLESDTFFTCNGLTGGEEGRIISAKVPEVGNGTITIKQGTANKGSFRMNQDNSATITLDAVQVIQVSTMPTANASNLGKIVQWIGATDTYTNGYFYKCVSDGAATPTYSWSNINVQAQGASSISTLTDVTLTSVSDGQTLVYDAASSKWVNGNGGVSATYNATTKTITFA